MDAALAASDVKGLTRLRQSAPDRANPQKPTMSNDTQTEANRANSLLSTGPLSVEGKSHSRRNALKSGLSGRGLILPENEAKLAESRKRSFATSFHLDKPDGFSEVLLTQIAVESVRIERCQQEEQLIREQSSAEAGTLWQIERKIAACELGKTIHEDPEIVRLKLEMTYYGNEWLKGRWMILHAALESRSTWDAVETAFAQDLSGTPAMLRESFTFNTLDERKALVKNELEKLGKVILDRYMQDQKSQDLAEVGVSSDLDKRLKTLKRYETASRRAFDKSLAELRRHLAEIKSNVKQANGLGQSAKPARQDYETKPLTDRQLGQMVKEINEELDELEANQTKRVDTAPTAPAPMGFSSRPDRHLNRQQRRTLEAAKRSA